MGALGGYLCVGLLLGSLLPGHGARILLLPPPADSQIFELVEIGNVLVRQGHDVYMALSETLPILDMFKNKKIHLLISKATHQDFFQWDYDKITDLFSRMIRDKSMIKTWRENIPQITSSCINPLTDDTFYQQLKQLHFDLAIVDIFPMNRCLLALPYSLGVPYIGLNVCYEPWISRTPALPSFNPSNILSASLSDKMTFLERFQNMWEQLMWLAFPGVDYVEDSFIKKYIRDKEPVGFDELFAKCSFFFADYEPLLDYPRPAMPNEVFVGGLTTGPAKPLPLDLQTFIDKRQQPVILMTFGSHSIDYEPEFLEELLEAFSNLKYTILWKYTGKVDSVPDNVKLSNWLPQNDILGHLDVKMFITHAGNNGQMEALYHGVPMIGLPGCGDQPHNCKRLTSHAIGICLDRENFKAQDLIDAVSEIEINSSYMNNIKKRSEMFRAKPMDPKQTAAFWVNYVLDHGGEELRTRAFEQHWYEYLMLDVLMVLGLGALLVLVAVVVVLYVIIKILIRITPRRTTTHIKPE